MSDSSENRDCGRVSGLSNRPRWLQRSCPLLALPQRLNAKPLVVEQADQFHLHG